MIGQQANLANAEIPEDLPADAKLTLVHWMRLCSNATRPDKVWQVHIRIGAASANLVNHLKEVRPLRQCPQVHQRTLARRADRAKRGTQRVLSAAIGTSGMHAEDVAQDITAMHANEHGIWMLDGNAIVAARSHSAEAQCQMRLGVKRTLPREQLERSLGRLDRRPRFR